MTVEDTIKLTVKSLLEVVQTGAKNIDLAVMEGHGKVRVRWNISFEMFIYLLLYKWMPRYVSSYVMLCWSFHEIGIYVQNLTLAEIEAVVAEIEKEKEAEAERKRSR